MINAEDFNSVVQILESRTKILSLNVQQMRLEHYQYAQELKVLDAKLYRLMESKTKYDFVSRINVGNSLLVGEGNLSFTMSLIKQLQQSPSCISSTYENYSDLSNLAQSNTVLLKNLGINILHNVDATKLHKKFNQNFFDTVIFQFPHSGSREGINGLNPNYVLVHDFIISASRVLKKNGMIIITIVDSDFYNNMFRFEELSQDLGIPKPIKYKFDPKDYPGYEHTMTHQDESGIEDYSAFATVEFRI